MGCYASGVRIISSRDSKLARRQVVDGFLANPPTNNPGKSGVNLQSASLRVIPTQQTAVSLASVKLTGVMNISAPDLDPTVSSKSDGISSFAKNLSIRRSHLQYEY
jgi:hypothetical protein